MEPAPPSPGAILAIAAVSAVTAIGLWATFAPIWWRAVRTGRLLARGRIYDRQTTPVMYWAGLISMFAITLFVTFAAIGLAVHAAARF